MKIKVISSWSPSLLPDLVEWDGVQFTRDPECKDYDWLMVYDEMPRDLNFEELSCPRSHTILVTQEPPTIKIYPPAYTKQFGYVLTTHDPDILRHPHYRRGTGCLVWMNNHSIEENRRLPQYEKTEMVSAVCSAKKHTHTEHSKRYKLLHHLLENLPGFVWWGEGINPIRYKYEAMDTYRYHVAIENHVHPYHWTEKISDALLSGCLPFYSGDPALEQVLPPRSFIRIPADDPEETLRIIKEAIENDEYSKRKDDIEAARRLLVERYNLWSQVLLLIAEHEREHSGETEPEPKRAERICNRRYMRLNPIVGLINFWNILRIKLFHRI